ncbi:unnamed protein product [Nippostrongylus brasiliensis]|uniref:Probable 28S ribosomal protein S16, mitochondrial (inferred by orthology to a C. elegans protein) n=1 Tax=Nippostrongylus brasiliensis TaxID=27835 RepID=A0A158QY19_NIPBR|nr:unnamed protein product [Nippostrongylus brasiliensis]
MLASQLPLLALNISGKRASTHSRAAPSDVGPEANYTVAGGERVDSAPRSGRSTAAPHPIEVKDNHHLRRPYFLECCGSHSLPQPPGEISTAKPDEPYETVSDNSWLYSSFYEWRFSGKMRKLVIPKYFGRPSIGLALFGCANRPFYHICIFPDRALGRRYESNIIEQERETCLAQLWKIEVLDRRKKRAHICSCSGAASLIQLVTAPKGSNHGNCGINPTIGLSGLFPIHPKTFIRARHNREQVAKSTLGDSVETTEVVEIFTVTMSIEWQKQENGFGRAELLCSPIRKRIITVSIFEHHSEGVLRPLESVNVVHPSTGFKWRNVAKGSYVVYAHIPRHDCSLICEEEPTIPCRLCPHTAINFTVPADRASMSWKGLRRMRDSGSSILYALTVPDNLSRLISLIHSIDACPVPAGCSAMDEFRQAVDAMEKKMRTDEDWMEQRLSPQNASVVAEVDLEEIPQKTSDRLVNNEQRAKAAEMFGLLPPEENEVLVASSFFFILKKTAALRMRARRLLAVILEIPVDLPMMAR